MKAPSWLERTGLALDRAIGWLAPRWGARRMMHRARMRAARAFYDGATVGRRGASIRRRVADPNVVTAATLPRLRAGARDLVRNNPHAHRAVEAIVSNAVGPGIGIQFMRDGERAEDIQALARRCLETTACDADGRHTYFGLQSCAFWAMVEAGEVLVRRRIRRPEDGFEVPVQFQLLEAEFLDERRDEISRPGGGKIVQGVEFDAIGRRRSYWLFRDHPGGRQFSANSRPIRATDVAHLYRLERPGQVRGIPWLATVMLTLADFADFKDAQLMRQKIAACFVGFVEESFDGAGLAPSVEKKGDDLIDTFEPGTIERLPPGSKISFGDPPQVNNASYVEDTLRDIAAGVGISFEALSTNLKGVNFSSGKMGRAEFERNTDRWRAVTFVPQFCDTLARWFLEGAELAGADIGGVTWQHIPPPRVMIDPPREFRAEKDAIRSGQKTLSQRIREMGRDPELHLKELAADNRRLDELGIILESDPRRDVSREGAGGTSGRGRPDTEALERLLEEIEDRLAAANGGRRW